MEDTCVDTPSLPEVIPGIKARTKAAEAGLPVRQVLDKTLGQTGRSLGAAAWLAVAGKSSGK